jgi:hypothetical protein
MLAGVLAGMLAGVLAWILAGCLPGGWPEPGLRAGAGNLAAYRVLPEGREI